MTGTMTVGTSAGPHMWNIVTFGSRNYLVDVTNCDADTVGAPDKLFLCGAAENEPSKKYTATAGSRSIVYEYDADTLSDYASSDLRLEEMPYSPTSVSGLTVSGTAVSWNDTNDALYYLYPSTMEDAAIKAEWKSGSYTGTACTSKGTPTASGKQFEQTFTFDTVAAGDYKLAIFKPDKYVPKIVSITVGTTDYTCGQLKLWLYGDVNYDGAVKTIDITMARQYFKGNLTLTDEQIAVMDMNGDGAIKVIDITILRQYFKGNISTIPVA